MSWANQLCKSYDCNIGKTDELSPISHTFINAHIEITINADGNFLHASIVDKEDFQTLCPVTEASKGRSNNIAPHALTDSLSYVAGDFYKYSKEQKDLDRFKAYLSNLSKWIDFDSNNPKLNAVYMYICQKNIIKDLSKAGLIEVENGHFIKKKINGKDYKDVVVRFRVVGIDIDSATWTDLKLINSYIDYIDSDDKGEKQFCYIDGTLSSVGNNHPKGIVTWAYNAKLLSCNDSENFTYRGRFLDSDEALTVSYQSSQKIHNALTWLAKTQGKTIGDKEKRVFIVWNPDIKEVPNIFKILNLENETALDDPTKYKKYLLNYFNGKKSEYDAEEKINIIALDAATTGRLSITYYNECYAYEFFKLVEDWCLSLNWYYYSKNGIRIDSPGLAEIVNMAYGTYRNERFETDDKVFKNHTQRLIECMLGKGIFPTDIMRGLFHHCNNLKIYKSYERLLSTTCAVIMKYYRDRGLFKEGGNQNMKLDVTNQGRSYLFGRLLAIYEKVEKSTYSKGEARETNAIRLQSAFVNHPMNTWKILENTTNPYFQKLPVQKREYYKKMISEIAILFKEEDQFAMNKGLDESYLLGYYLQREELKYKGE